MMKWKRRAETAQQKQRESFDAAAAALLEEAQSHEHVLKEFPLFRAFMLETIKLGETYCHPTLEDMKLRAAQNTPYNEDLELWKKTESIDRRHYETQRETHEREIHTLRKRVRVYESYILEEAIPDAIDKTIHERKLGDVPFVYYGFNTHRLVFTPATPLYLGVDSLPESVSLMQLLGYVTRYNAQGTDVKQKIVNVLRHNSYVRGLEAQTLSGETIHITTRPYHFGKRDPRLIGVGISFNNPFFGAETLKSIIGAGTGKIHNTITDCIKTTRRYLEERGIDV